jgi:hypothetical protein
MRRSEAFPSSYVTAADLKDRGDIPVTIGDVVYEDVGDPPERKAIMFFNTNDATLSGKKLVLNGTRWDAIADLYGDESDEWSGKPIALCCGRAMFKGKGVDTVAIRSPRPARPATPPQLRPQQQRSGDVEPPPHDRVPDDFADEIPF